MVINIEWHGLDYLSVMRFSTFDEQIPLAEVITDFFDQLKSRTKGTLLFHPSSDHLIDIHPTPSHLSSGYASTLYEGATSDMKVLHDATVQYIRCLDRVSHHTNICFHVMMTTVSRSLAACEGVLLVVDASQGEEAQTMAHVYLALENDLSIIPVINKIDLPSADPDKVIEEVENTIGLDCSDALKCSAKTGFGGG